MGDGELRRRGGIDDGGETRPRCGHFHRVDHISLAGERLERGRVVAVRVPAVDQGDVCNRSRARRHCIGRHGHRRLDEHRVTLVEHEQDAARPVAAVAARRLHRVVEAEHRRRRAAAKDLPACLEAVTE